MYYAEKRTKNITHLMGTNDDWMASKYYTMIKKLNGMAMKIKCNEIIHESNVVEIILESAGGYV